MKRRTGHDAFRRHLALTVALVTMGFSLMAALLMFVPVFALLDSGELAPEVAGGVAAYVLHLHQAFWPVVAGAMMGSVASGLLLFQRMRSPLLRFASVYRRLAAGESPEPIELRVSDYLHEEAEQLNELARTLAERRAAMERELERLAQALAELPPDRDAKLSATLDEALDAVAALRRCLTGPT